MFSILAHSFQAVPNCNDRPRSKFESMMTRSVSLNQISKDFRCFDSVTYFSLIKI